MALITRLGDHGYTRYSAVGAIERKRKPWTIKEPPDEAVILF